MTDYRDFKGVWEEHKESFGNYMANCMREWLEGFFDAYALDEQVRLEANYKKQLSRLWQKLETANQERPYLKCHKCGLILEPDYHKLNKDGEWEVIKPIKHIEFCSFCGTDLREHPDIKHNYAYGQNKKESSRAGDPKEEAKRAAIIREIKTGRQGI